MFIYRQKMSATECHDRRRFRLSVSGLLLKGISVFLMIPLQGLKPCFSGISNAFRIMAHIIFYLAVKIQCSVFKERMRGMLSGMNLSTVTGRDELNAYPLPDT